MKPVSVRFRCFGPYMAEQYIDFRELEKSGLFLICGETGAGKTTILDAICYALYGRSSGGLRGDMSVMRCKLAKKEDETLTEFIFDSNGKRYQFIRTLKYGRKNLNDTHNCLVLEGEEFVPIFENPKATVVNKKAEELIGLSYDQFRQVILLPQGQFEKLLVSNSEEKEKILVSLFQADRWQKIAEEVYNRVSRQDKELNLEKQQIASKLAEYGCKNPEQLAEKRDAQLTLRDSLREESGQRKQQLARQQAVLEAALLEDQDFRNLSKLEGEWAKLESKTAYFQALENTLSLADAAERIRPQFASWQDAAEKKNRAQPQWQRRQEKRKRAQSWQEDVQKQLTALESEKPQQAQRQLQLALLENARGVYHTLEEKRQNLAAARKSLASAQLRKEKSEKACSRCDQRWQEQLLAQKKAMDAYQQAQTAYLRGIGGELAKKLVAGEPCPVCGSCHHPAPVAPGADHISEQTLDELNAAMNIANDRVSAALREKTAAEKERSDAVELWNLAAQREALAGNDYENALSRKMPGIEDLKQLEMTLRDMKKAAEVFARAYDQAVKAGQDAAAAVQAAAAEEAAGAEEFAAAKGLWDAQLAKWQDSLEASGLHTEAAFLAADKKPEEKQRLTTQLLTYRGDKARVAEQLAQQRTLLAGRTAPDLEAIRTRRQQLEGASKQTDSQLVLAEKLLETMTADAANLKKRSETHDALRQKVDADLEFANRLRGRSGVSLQRYVLGVMLTAITYAANKLLENVYAGRYRLYRTDEIAGSARKGGLELEVFDSHNNQRRSVTTLSGGEKFLVALSLAIGLSTVVQAQGSGIRLEAMFIDEGFGSLDRDAVNDALEVLQGIQKGAGLVGIISHVEQLEETIPGKIRVQKGKNGSTCTVHC